MDDTSPPPREIAGTTGSAPASALPPADARVFSTSEAARLLREKRQRWCRLRTLLDLQRSAPTQLPPHCRTQLHFAIRGPPFVHLLDEPPISVSKPISNGQTGTTGCSTQHQRISAILSCTSIPGVIWYALVRHDTQTSQTSALLAPWRPTSTVRFVVPATSLHALLDPSSQFTSRILQAATARSQ